MSRHVRLSGLPRSFLRARPGSDEPTPRAVLCSMATPFGFAGNIVLIHAARVAILEMVSAAAAAAMVVHHADNPFLICGRPVTLGLSDEGVRPTRPVEEVQVVSKCFFCIESLVAELERVRAYHRCT